MEKSLALSWTAYEGPGALGAFLGMARAQTVGDLVRAWEGVAGPSMNLVAADVDGRILHHVLGREPMRGRGAGRLPAPGTDGAWEWDGLHPLARNPGATDPEEGFLVTANHDLFAEGDYPASRAFPADFASPWRVRRIRHVLASRTDWDVEACQVLQGDVVSGRAIAVLKTLWPDLERHGGSTAAELLQWNGSMDAESRVPLAYSRLLLELSREVGEDEARTAGLDGSPVTGTRLVRLLAGGISEAWWDDVRTSRRETRTDILGRCLDGQDAGRGVETWGRAHRVLFAHPLHELPLIGPLFGFVGSRGPFEVPGDGTTVNAHYSDGGRPFEVTVIPSLRFVADVGDWDRSVLALPVGQSGRPWSSHYADQVGDWLDVKARRLPFSPDSVRAAARATVVLVPE
jgi:penicillin amidase